MKAADDLEWFLKARMYAKLDTAEEASSVLPGLLSTQKLISPLLPPLPYPSTYTSKKEKAKNRAVAAML